MITDSLSYPKSRDAIASKNFYTSFSKFNDSENYTTLNLNIGFKNLILSQVLRISAAWHISHLHEQQYHDYKDLALGLTDFLLVTFTRQVPI